jgi:hypothetical protein
MILRLWDYFERSKPERQAYKKYLLTVVKRLGLPSDGNLEETIIQYVLDKVEGLLAAQGITESFNDPDEVVRSVATCLNLDFVEIHNDNDLQSLPSHLPFEFELVVTLLQMQLCSKDTYAVTIIRQARAHWEQPFLAVIDCRIGKDSFHRGLFSKWHEVAHLLLDEKPSQSVFRRSMQYHREPEELLADRVARKFYLPALKDSFCITLYELLKPICWQPRLLLATPLIVYIGLLPAMFWLFRTVGSIWIQLIFSIVKEGDNLEGNFVENRQE